MASQMGERAAAVFSKGAAQPNQLSSCPLRTCAIEGQEDTDKVGSGSLQAHNVSN